MTDAIATPMEAKLLDFSIVRPNSLQPTVEAYSDLLNAFHHLNARLFAKLFGNELSEPLITLARKPGMIGAFCANRFRSRAGDNAHEIILNPQYLSSRSDFVSLSTLAHEMAHQWREEFGPENRAGSKGSRGYHDAIWAECMERIGLMPSDTGKSGGKRTGPRVSHYVIEDGPFATAAQELLDSGFVIRWADRPSEDADQVAGGSDDGSGDAASKSSGKTKARRKKKDRIAFSCMSCGQNAWAAPSARLKCAPCDELLIPKPQKEKPNETPV